MPLPSRSRRELLSVLGLGAAGLLSRPAAAAVPADGTDEGACLLTPQAIEGPFYTDPRLVRTDITEGRAGVPLRLRLRVIEAGPCTPLAGARVDVWHCDAQGLYSAYPGQGDTGRIDTSGQTFLRGTQETDAGGWAAFDTIYPGWYPGRATHIHLKVFLDRRTVLTGQIYFPDALSEFLYTQVPAYGGRKVERLVVNANDGIAREEDPQRRAFCAVKEERDRYVASLVIGVNRGGDVSGLTDRSVTPFGQPESPPGPPPGGFGPPRLALKDRLAALVPGLGRRP